MFYYLDGLISHIGPQLAVVDCGGVGYACRTTSTTLSQLKKGEAHRLYTHLNVGDGIFDLYGFATENELDCFRLLLGVSGVGPKAALALLSSSTPDEISMAILTGNERILMNAPGIGKKIAQRIILELKDKISKQEEELAGAFSSSGGNGAGGKAAEAASALAVLGYSQADISAALRGLDVQTLSLEELVRQALKRMVK